MIVFVLSIGFAQGALTDNIRYYYSMDDSDVSGTTLIDSAGIANATMDAGVGTFAGIIGEARDVANGEKFDITDLAYSSGNAFTINYWVNVDAFIGGQASICGTVTNSVYTSRLSMQGHSYPNGGDYITSTDTELETGNWQMITLQRDASNSIKWYKNGTADSTPFSNTGTFTFEVCGSYYNGGISFDGKYDEFGFWDRELTPTELTELYNGGAGFNPYATVPPPDTINLTALNPLNDESFLTNNISINATGNFSYPSLTNCSLSINGTTNQTINGFASGTDVLVEFNVSFPIESSSRTAKISCIDNTTSENTTTNTFYIDAVFPIIVNDFQNNSIYYKRNIVNQFNFTDDLSIFSWNVTLDGVQLAGDSDVEDSFAQYNLSIDPETLSVGYHNLTVRMADGHTDEKLKDKGAYNPDTGLIFHDSIKYKIAKPYVKKNIEIYSKEGSLFDTWDFIVREDRISEIYRPYNPRSEVTITTKSDEYITIMGDKTPKSKYLGYWLIIGNEHWKDFVPANEPNAYIKNIKRISPYEVDVTLAGLEHPEEITFESTGDLNIIEEQYIFHTVNVTESYTEAIVEGAATNLYLNITGFNSSYATRVDWNNTNYTSTRTDVNSTLIAFSNSITPSGFTNRDTVNHLWYFNLAGTFENTSIKTQTVFIPVIEKCSNDATNYTILNITYYDETTSDQINVSNAYDLKITDGTNNFNQISSFINQNNSLFCTNLPPALPYSWDMYGSFSLQKDGYVTRIIDIDAGTPTELSNNPYTNQSLFMIAVNKSTTITYTWLTTNFLLIDGTMRVYKCNIDGTQEIIESVPIISGTSVANIELLTSSYAYDVIIDGVVYSSPTGYGKCHIEANSAITFYVDIGEENVGEYVGLTGISCNLAKSGGNTVTMSWGTNPELEGYVQGCISAYRNSIQGAVQTYYNCSEDPNYDLVVGIPLNGYTYTIKGELIQNSSIYKCTDEVQFVTVTNSYEMFGITGLFAALLFLIAMVLFYAGDGEMQLAGLAAGIIGVYLLGITGFSWLWSSGILMFCLVIIWVGRYNRK